MIIIITFGSFEEIPISLSASSTHDSWSDTEQNDKLQITKFKLSNVREYEIYIYISLEEEIKIIRNNKNKQINMRPQVLLLVCSLPLHHNCTFGTSQVF